MEGIKQSEVLLYDQNKPCSDRAEKLKELYLYLNHLKEENRERYDFLYNSLRENTKSALKKLKKCIRYPREGIKGHFEKTSNGKKFFLSEKHPLYEVCKKAGMVVCEYGPAGEPNFDCATEKNTVVNCDDLYDKYTSSQLKARGGGHSFDSSFQDEAQKRIAQNKQSEIIEYWNYNHPNKKIDLYDAYYEWRDSKNPVPHEDANCKTMRLVNRVVHKDIFIHIGGISMIRIIKDFFG